MNELIVTDGDRTLCKTCYEAEFDELDPATHLYGMVKHGECDSCMAAAPSGTLDPIVMWPVQCSCGHIYLEKYQLPEPNAKGDIGFCWCGFCRTKRMVKPHNAESEVSE